MSISIADGCDRRETPVHFEEHVKQGARFIEYLSMPDAEALTALHIDEELSIDEELQSRFSQYDDLAANKWEASRNTGRTVDNDLEFWTWNSSVKDALDCVGAHGLLQGNFEMLYDHPCGKYTLEVRVRKQLGYVRVTADLRDRKPVPSTICSPTLPRI